MKKVSIFAIIYALVIILLSTLSANNLAIENDGLVNIYLTSFAVININSFYILITSLFSNSKDILKKEMRSIFSAITVVSMIYKEHLPLMFWLIGLYSIIILVVMISDANKKEYLIDLIAILFAIGAVYLNLNILLCLFLIFYVIYTTNKFYGYKNLNQMTLLPIGRDRIPIFTIIYLIVFLALIYILDLDALRANIINHIFLFVFELLILFHILDHGKAERNPYKNISELYYLSEYLSKERINFSEILHDELLQDLMASCNMLELKQPDSEAALEILKPLQNKMRKLMNYYNSVVFYDLSFYDNFESILDTIGPIYPKQEINFQFHITERATELLKNKQIMNTSLKISKELINNVYKHSQATYAEFNIYDKENRIFIECSNDGVNEENYRKVMKSKGGILILGILVSNYGGDIRFDFEDNILKVLIRLEGQDENSYI
ncbi:Signal transduction histidine kinase [Anaerosphaera aminiphila DSM 21120]|uniref:Signal transduction histidine kinase n=1 Tax=Anaerosphaera aminiphila DSM 21120 TaxID=1120995 RepID=A0A1M5V376_9FIRM|nr:hypothetical protein [Anaerosphaera aminiphila]SHH69675.1 Signal transduction histidine kinase [Anaerosphaera aminiphila DSM 21120]